MEYLSFYPVTVTATDITGGTTTTTVSSSSVGFVGFSSTKGLQTIRVSSPSVADTPIVNIGNITYR